MIPDPKLHGPGPQTTWPRTPNYMAPDPKLHGLLIGTGDAVAPLGSGLLAGIVSRPPSRPSSRGCPPTRPGSGSVDQDGPSGSAWSAGSAGGIGPGSTNFRSGAG